MLGRGIVGVNIRLLRLSALGERIEGWKWPQKGCLMVSHNQREDLCPRHDSECVVIPFVPGPEDGVLLGEEGNQ